MLIHSCRPCTGFITQEEADLMRSEHVWVEVATLMTRLGFEKVNDVRLLLKTVGTVRVCVSTDFGQ
jgi:hypothetical protein